MAIALNVYLMTPCQLNHAVGVVGFSGGVPILGPLPDVSRLALAMSGPTEGEETGQSRRGKRIAKAKDLAEGDAQVVLDSKPDNSIVLVGTNLKIEDEYMTVSELGESEIATTQWTVQKTDTDIALAAVPTTVEVGSVFLIDLEYMKVTDVSNVDNPVVERGSFGTAIVEHSAGTKIIIWASEADLNILTVTRAAGGSTMAEHAVGTPVLIGVALL